MMKLNKKKLCMAMAMAGSMLGTSLAQAQIEEVVVTAQKRAASAQDLGLSVTAFSGDQLKEAGVLQAADIAAQTPGLTVNYAWGNTVPVFTMRGVGLNDYSPNNNPAVAVYVDEAFKMSPSLLQFGIFDMERVEALKGPQGTLYGRNSTGGAIGFFTKKPTEEFESYITADYGRFDYKLLEGAVSGPLSDTVRGRLSVQTVQQGKGHQTNIDTGKDNGQLDRVGWRGQLAVDVSDTVSVNLGVHGGYDKSDMVEFSYMDGGQPVNGDVRHIGRADSVGGPNSLGPWNGDELQMDDKTVGGVVSVEWAAEDFTLTAITAYDQMDRNEPIDQLGVQNALTGGGSFGAGRFTNEIESLSQEIRLTSNGTEGWSWIAGVIASKDEVIADEVIDLVGLDLGIVRSRYKQETESMGAYLHTEWELSDALRLNAAARYSYMDKSWVGGTTIADASATNSDPSYVETVEDTWEFLTGRPADTMYLGDYLASASQGFDDDNISWRIGLDYDLSEDILLYTSVSRGYKDAGVAGVLAFSEGADPTPSGAVSPYHPYNPIGAEQLTAYELGLKGMFLDDTLRINGAAFFYDYKDMQVSDIQLLPGDLPAQILRNADEAEIEGAEMDVLWAPTGSLEGFEFSANAAYTNATLTGEFIGIEGASLKGAQLANAPLWTWGAAASYEFEVAQGMYLKFAADTNFVGENYSSIVNAPGFLADDHRVVNARITLASDEDTWSVAAWGKNLEDKVYTTFPIDYPGFGASAAQGLHTAGMPATYGVSVTYNFQ